MATIALDERRESWLDSPTRLKPGLLGPAATAPPS